MAWAPQLRNVSCLSPQPEHAQIDSKAHSVPKLPHQMPCSISPPPFLPCSTVAPAPHPPAPFCLLSPVKTTAFAEPFTAVLNQSSSSRVLLSIHMIFCPWPQRRSRAHVWRLLQQTCCFHHDAVPWSCTATIADLPLLSSLVWRPGPPKHQDLLFPNFRQVL